MASMLLRPLLRPQSIGIGLGLGLSSLIAFPGTLQRPMRLDSDSLSTSSYQRDIQTRSRPNGPLNPRAVRQISSGSIIGLCAGLAVSTFSRTLAVLIGLLVVGVQWAASYGVKVLPYGKLQRYITNIDMRSAIQDNVAFKLSFGVTFSLAAFISF